MKGSGGVAAGIWLMAGVMAWPAAADTLDDVRERGAVNCGIQAGRPGFAEIGESGAWEGFDTDYCRAVAAAVFDDPDAVNFVIVSASERFSALQLGQVDLLARLPWTMSYDASLGFHFVGVSYYDGQGLLVPALGADAFADLRDSTICVAAGSTETDLRDAAGLADIAVALLSFPSLAEAAAAYQRGDCQALSAYLSDLYPLRATLRAPSVHRILSDVVSRGAQGPAVRQDDDRWFAIVKWVHQALLNAEALGVTAANAGGMRASPNEDLRLLLGTEGNLGELIGLSGDWAFDVIRHVGNYGEIFDRNLGRGSLGIPRGENALSTDGGLQYPLPMR